jgi:ketosteroid isomerase-like protein
MKKVIFILIAGTYHCFGLQAASVKTQMQNIEDTSAVRQAISKVNKLYGDAFLKSDSSLFLNAYAPDACLLPAYMPALCVYKAGIRNVLFTTTNLYGLTDEYVTEEGHFETFGANNVSLGKGKYLVVWKKTSAGWKMYRDMFSGDAPPHKTA